jgi:hypothetical protein
MAKDTKRKLKTTEGPRKRSKTQDELSWKSVGRKQTGSGMDAFDGMLELEEVNDVEVYYEEIEGGGKIARFRVQEEDEDVVGVWSCFRLRNIIHTVAGCCVRTRTGTSREACGRR